jgi:hypothetical protein
VEKTGGKKASSVCSTDRPRPVKKDLMALDVGAKVQAPALK